MYLNEQQVNRILNTPHFSQSFTESFFTYVLYRGRYNAKVYTVRYNVKPALTEDFIFNHLYSELQLRFPHRSHLKASIKYDLLLCNPTLNPVTYYIWRANSNERHFVDQNEISLNNLPEDIFNFIRGSPTVDVENLNINFETSSIVVCRVLAVVFSFVTI